MKKWKFTSRTPIAVEILDGRVVRLDGFFSQVYEFYFGLITKERLELIYDSFNHSQEDEYGIDDLDSQFNTYIMYQICAFEKDNSNRNKVQECHNKFDFEIEMITE